MKKSTTLMLALAACLAVPTMDAKINQKFFRKAADKVWKTGAEYFDPKVEIPDSISADASAVIIADYNFVDVDRNYFENNFRTTDQSKRTKFTRTMVKILDESALEKFSEFKFGSKQKVMGMFNIQLSAADHAFGARVHKPDGQVKDIDISEALPESTGKKGDNVTSYRIAIPDLEPGDVIEYFYYSEESNDFDNLPAFEFNFNHVYPTLNYVIDGVFSPAMTVSYRGYNGAPQLNYTTDEKGKRYVVKLHATNVPVVTDEYGVRPERQLPMFKFFAANNNSPYFYHPVTARGGGMYNSPNPGTIYRDIASTLANSSYDNSAVYPNMKKRVNEFIKNHPDLSTDEKIDGAWIAAIYGLSTTPKVTSSDYFFSVMFADILRSHNLVDPAEIGVAFINSRNDVATREILDWEQPNFGVLVGNKLLLPSAITYSLPSELPGDYHGEEGGAYMGPRQNLTRMSTPTLFTVPLSTPGKNVFDLKIDMTANLPTDYDSKAATANHNLSLSGTFKNLTFGLTNTAEWNRAVEDFLGIPENKRWKGDKTDQVERNENVTELTTDLAKNIFGDKIGEITGVTITERGVTPDAPNFKLSFDGKYDEMFSRAGNNWLFSVGRLFPDSHHFKSKERERQIEYFRTSPAEYRMQITVAPPEGYAFDAESVAQLSTNTANPLGLFYVSASVDEDGNLTIQGVERHKYYMVSTENWPALLDLLDAAAAFNEASVLLRKK